MFSSHSHWSPRNPGPRNPGSSSSVVCTLSNHQYPTHQSTQLHAWISGHTSTLNSQLPMGGLTRFSGLTVLQMEKHWTWCYTKPMRLWQGCGVRLMVQTPPFCLSYYRDTNANWFAPHQIDPGRTQSTRKHSPKTPEWLHCISVVPHGSCRPGLPCPRSQQHPCTSPSRACRVCRASLHTCRPGDDKQLIAFVFTKTAHRFRKLKRHYMQHFALTKVAGCF